MATRVEELYDEDFHAWALGQADALRRLVDRLPPTLRRNVEHDLPALQAQARRMVAADALPPANRYGLDALLTDDWYPASTHDVRVGGA